MGGGPPRGDPTVNPPLVPPTASPVPAVAGGIAPEHHEREPVPRPHGNLPSAPEPTYPGPGPSMASTRNPPGPETGTARPYPHAVPERAPDPPEELRLAELLAALSLVTD